MIAWIWMIVRTFFGWNENNETKHNEEKWFIEEIISTWDTIPNSTGTTTSINTNKPEKSNSKYTEIKVIMPRYFYNSGRKVFAEDLINKNNIYVNFTFIDDLNKYRDEITNKNFSRADLLLFPYDRHEMVSTHTFSLNEIIDINSSSNNTEINTKSYFDKFISDTINNNQIWFLPFAADPMILYTTTSQIPKNFDDIYDIIFTRDPVVQIAFPVFFGITNEDYNNEWFEREYQDIVRYALMHYFKKYWDVHSLLTRIDTNIEGNNDIKNYNITNLNYILNIINRQECEFFPSICFQLRNFVGIRFWFLSDIDIVQRYFPNKESNFNKISKTTLPFSIIESPVRLRWRWINNTLDDTKTINAIYTFLKKYMNKHNEYQLRNSTLPTFKSENSLINNKYIWSRWYILESWWDYINNLRNTNAFRQLIKYQISAEDYLSKAK